MTDTQKAGKLKGMSQSLIDFIAAHPFWAAIIIVFMILPMVGAVFHIVMKALGRRGIDNSPPAGIPSEPDRDDPDSAGDG